MVATLVSPFNELRAAEFTRLIGGNHTGSTLNNVFVTTSSNGGSNVISGGVDFIHSGTNSNGSASEVTVNVARFLSGLVNHYLGGVALVTPPIANNTRRWGVYDPTNPSGDGFYFEQAGLQFNVVIRKAGVETRIPSGSFSGGQPFVTGTPDTNFHVYECTYNAGNVYFFQSNALLHTYTNSVSAVTDSLHLKIGAENFNTGVVSGDSILGMRGTSVARYGKEAGQPTHVLITSSGTATVKTCIGSIHRIVINSSAAPHSSLSLYNGLSSAGPLLCTIDVTAQPMSLEYGIVFDTGLTYVASGSQINATIVSD